MTSYTTDSEALIQFQDKHNRAKFYELKMAPSNIHFKTSGFTTPRVLVACLFGLCFVLYLSYSNVFSWSQTVNMKELLSVSIDLAERGGREVKRVHTAHKGLQEVVKGETLEGAKEMKTEGDLASHRAMVYGLLKAYKNIQVISEENEKSKLSMDEIKQPNKFRVDVQDIADEHIPLEEITVWIDPLDATQEYTESLTWYVTTMVCVAIKGRPTIGVIHLPFEGKTVWGYVNKGHSNNFDLDTKEHKADTPYKIIVSRSHAGEVENVAKKALGDKTEIVPAGGAGFKTLQVIQGNADAYIHVTRIKKWDICAGNAIINAVNGHMTTLNNVRVNYTASGSEKNDDGLLATLQGHNKFLEALKPAFENMKKEKH